MEHPYRTLPYAEQRIPSDGPHLQGMYFTPVEAELSSWIAQQARELDAEDVPTVAISAPGALLQFNNSPFASPWVDAFWPVSFDSVAAACTAEPPTDMFVLQPGTQDPASPSYQGFADSLRDGCGFEFPADFTEVAHRSDSNNVYEVTIWRLSR